MAVTEGWVKLAIEQVIHWMHLYYECEWVSEWYRVVGVQGSIQHKYFELLQWSIVAQLLWEDRCLHFTLILSTHQLMTLKKPAHSLSAHIGVIATVWWTSWWTNWWTYGHVAHTICVCTLTPSTLTMAPGGAYLWVCVALMVSVCVMWMMCVCVCGEGVDKLHTKMDHLWTACWWYIQREKRLEGYTPANSLAGLARTFLGTDSNRWAISASQSTLISTNSLGVSGRKDWIQGPHFQPSFIQTNCYWPLTSSLDHAHEYLVGVV